jgi:NitT/TauT family transport system ATP-binding protein
VIGEDQVADEGKIELRGISRVFPLARGEYVALRDINLTVGEQEFVCIVGPSGCGKSSLLRMLAGLDTASSGTLTVRQTDPKRMLSAMVFQEESVFPWLTVEANAAYALKITGRYDRRTSPQQIDYFLEQTGLTPYRRFYPHQLSGGMKQRLSIARAFVPRPEVLLMDEPFAALDEQNKLLLQQELEKLWGETRSAVVFITHSIDEAILLGDRVVVMTSAPGQIKADIKIPFTRPRQLSELKATSEFGQLYGQIWNLLRSEVLAARARSAASAA